MAQFLPAIERRMSPSSLDSFRAPTSLPRLRTRAGAASRGRGGSPKAPRPPASPTPPPKPPPVAAHGGRVAAAAGGSAAGEARPSRELWREDKPPVGERAPWGEAAGYVRAGVGRLGDWDALGGGGPSCRRPPLLPAGVASVAVNGGGGAVPPPLVSRPGAKRGTVPAWRRVGRVRPRVGRRQDPAVGEAGQD